MTQPYADAVGALLDQGYHLENITQPEVFHQALVTWLNSQVDAAIKHHAATCGNGHQPEERCESWYALHDCLTMMHDQAYRFTQALDLDTPTK